MDLCHWIIAHPQLLRVILFSDEAFFTWEGINNSQNLHTWSHDNPHETSVTNFQRRFSVNVWCGVLGNKLIGPFVFDNNLTGNTYEVFLRNELPGFLEDIPLIIMSQMYFQHDGAPPHSTWCVREYLKRFFPEPLVWSWWTHCTATEVTRSYTSWLLSLGPHEDISVWN